MYLNKPSFKIGLDVTKTQQDANSVINWIIKMNSLTVSWVLSVKHSWQLSLIDKNKEAFHQFLSSNIDFKAEMLP